MQIWRQFSLTGKILFAMMIGVVVGISLNQMGQQNNFVQHIVLDGVLEIMGAIFVAGLKMLVVPLVFVSLVGGVTALGDMNKLGRIGGKALFIYLLTTAIAISLALFLAHFINAGQGFDLSHAATNTFQSKPAPSFVEVLIGIVPSNPISAMAEGNMLQIIIFALLFGVSISLAGENGKHVLNFFNDLNEVIMKMVDIVMSVAPFGVFALITKTFATQGIEVILPLMGYFMTVVLALLLHSIGTYGIFLKFAKLNPLTFLQKMRPVFLFAFSTASSNATIPVSLKTLEERMGVDNAIASFTVPLGATINMDGTAIMQGVATVFIANVYGIELGLSAFLMIILTATLASIGTAGVPGVGLVMLTMVLNQVGLPVEGIALIIGVDRLLDMMRTVVNVTGDAMVTCLIAKSENAFNQEVFDKPE